VEKNVPAKNIEDVKFVRHHLDFFDRVINANCHRIDVFNNLARQLIHDAHPKSEAIITRQNQINASWAELCARAKAKRDKIESVPESVLP